MFRPWFSVRGAVLVERVEHPPPAGTPSAGAVGGGGPPVGGRRGAAGPGRVRQVPPPQRRPRPPPWPLVSFPAGKHLRMAGRDRCDWVWPDMAALRVLDDNERGLPSRGGETSAVFV